MQTQEQLVALYEKYKDLNPVIVQLNTQGGWESGLIRWATWGEYSHADLVLPDGRLLGARMDGGVQIRPTQYGNFTKQTNFIVSSKLTGGHLDPEKVFEYAKSQIGLPYDYRGIINFGFHARRWHDANRWFCSELVAASFDHAGYPVVDVPEADRVSPRDLSISPFLVTEEEVSLRKCECGL